MPGCEMTAGERRSGPIGSGTRGLRVEISAGATTGTTAGLGTAATSTGWDASAESVRILARRSVQEAVRRMRLNCAR